MVLRIVRCCTLTHRRPGHSPPSEPLLGGRGGLKDGAAQVVPLNLWMAPASPSRCKNKRAAWQVYAASLGKAQKRPVRVFYKFGTVCEQRSGNSADLDLPAVRVFSMAHFSSPRSIKPRPRL